MLMFRTFSRPLVAAVALAAALPIVSVTARAADPTAAAAPGPELLPVGAAAPEVTATAHDGQKVTLSALKGKFVVLYFYPKDDTPGCTKQACEFRDAWDKLKKAGVRVFGVSTDDSASHKAFATKYNLPFPLLPDPEARIAGAYKVPVSGGRARRVTYLIGKDGTIKHVWPGVKPLGHAADVLSKVVGPPA